MLALLDDGPRHGYALKVAFEEATVGAWRVNVGQVYSALQRLERHGLVEPDGEEGGCNRVTGAGRQRAERSFHQEPIASERNRDSPREVRQLGRTMRPWRNQIAAWHQAQISNGPTETANGLAKRIKRIAFGLRNFVHWRIRVLLYAAKPDWSKLATVTP